MPYPALDLRKSVTRWLALVGIMAGTPAFGAPRSDVDLVVVSARASFEADLPKLRFADLDADRFANAMLVSGQVPPGRVHVLHGPTVRAFRAEMARLAANPGVGTKRKLIFYYSGHSDDRGLHLGDGLVSRDELQAVLAGLAYATKVVILDSCYSGALAAKGIARQPDFHIPKMDYDEPSGSVFLTAASAQTAAFESAALEGSVFTHFLVEGLYGQADANHDGVVTVDELYQYAYAKTKWQSTTSPLAQEQRPEFISNLHGEGALVLSYPAQTTGRLVLSADLAGEVALRTRSGLVTFRLYKAVGTDSGVELPPGTYDLSVLDKQRLGLHTLTISAQSAVAVSRHDLRWGASLAPTLVAKGGEARAGASVDVVAGIQSGAVPAERAGPIVGARYLSAPLADTSWVPRWTAALAVRQNNLSDARASAASYGAKIAAGAELVQALPGLGLSLGPLASVGQDYHSQTWRAPDGGHATYAAWAPVYDLGLTLVTSGLARRWSVDVQREVLAANDLSGRAMRLYSTIVSLGMQL